MSKAAELRISVILIDLYQIELRPVFWSQGQHNLAAVAESNCVLLSDTSCFPIVLRHSCPSDSVHQIMSSWTSRNTYTLLRSS